MSAYKIKSISNDSITIQYAREDGFVKELIVNVDASWARSRIEEEIAKQKAMHDQIEIKTDLERYFSVGEELQFADVIPEESPEEINRKFEEEQRIIEEENSKLKKGITKDYPHINPPIEEQLDALYWMRQGDMDPIRRVDQKISEIKAQNQEE